MSNRRKGKRAGQSFAAIPRGVMDNPDYKSVSGNGVKLLVELAYQYRGYNNGDLTTAFSVLKNRGWSSRQTIDRAKKELLKHGLILQTREGKFLNPGGRCALYALTWLPVDECQGKDLEVKPTNTPPRTFKRGGDSTRAIGEIGKAGKET